MRRVRNEGQVRETPRLAASLSETILQRANKTCRTHILQDLEPHLCPLTFCDHFEKAYAACRRLIEHLDQFHAFAADTGRSSSYIFCSEKLENSRKERIRHIGRYMEDIAFLLYQEPTTTGPFSLNQTISKSRLSWRV